MRTIETTAVVTPNHSMTIQVPDDIPVGTHRVVVVVEAASPLDAPPTRWVDWPAHNVTLVDPTSTFRREELYGDDGR